MEVRFHMPGLQEAKAVRVLESGVDSCGLNMQGTAEAKLLGKVLE
jgi:hypothetical protein